MNRAALKVDRGDLVDYSFGNCRLPLDVLPPGIQRHDEILDLCGPVWPVNDLGLVVEIAIPSSARGKKWVKVLLSTGVGWCDEEEIVVIQKGISICP